LQDAEAAQLKQQLSAAQSALQEQQALLLASERDREELKARVEALQGTLAQLERWVKRVSSVMYW
jgi:hypothetical protein